MRIRSFSNSLSGVPGVRGHRNYTVRIRTLLHSVIPLHPSTSTPLMVVRLRGDPGLYGGPPLGWGDEGGSFWVTPVHRNSDRCSRGPTTTVEATGRGNKVEISLPILHGRRDRRWDLPLSLLVVPKRIFYFRDQTETR